MDLNIGGRTAIVCASSAGLGRACAEALAAEGVQVVLNGRNEAAVVLAASQIADSYGVPAFAVTGDIAASETRARLLDVCPQPDIVVTNSGGPRAGALAELGPDDWRDAFEHNMLAHVEMVRAVVDGMCERRFGRIVNITSAMVTTPRPTMALSSGVRTGLTAVMKGVALHAAEFNVTINNILPERIDSQRQIDMAHVAVRRDGITWDEARARQVRSIAAKRLGRPEEIGAACAFLCSDVAGFISGQNLHLDGGSYPALV